MAAPSSRILGVSADAALLAGLRASLEGAGLELRAAAPEADVRALAQGAGLVLVDLRAPTPALLAALGALAADPEARELPRLLLVAPTAALERLPPADGLLAYP